VQITSFNSEGKKLESLFDEEEKPGSYEVEFSNCHSAKSGILKGSTYFYRLGSRRLQEFERNETN